jgi:hypothetical protein
VNVDPGDGSTVNESSQPARRAGDSTIKRTRRSPEKIIRKIKSADQLIARGQTVTEAGRAGGLRAHLTVFSHQVIHLPADVRAAERECGRPRT